MQKLNIAPPKKKEEIVKYDVIISCVEALRA